MRDAIDPVLIEWLDGWLPVRAVPKRMIPLLHRAYATVLESLLPAGEELAQSATAPIIARAKTLKVGGNPDGAAKFYGQLLSDIPIDLLETATHRIMTTGDWSERLPLPAEVRNQISVELDRRTTLSDRISLALKFSENWTSDE